MLCYRMPLAAAKIKAGTLLLIAFASGIALSCSAGKKGLELPSNPILGIESRWGAVSSAYVRVKSKPSSQADDIAYLRKTEIVEVVSRDIGKECLEEETGFWYGLKAGDSVGWIFSGYLEVYDSRDKAERAARNLVP